MGRTDAPLGHAILANGRLKPMLARPDGDNPAVLGPAGTVHLSVLRDFAMVLMTNAGGKKADAAFLAPSEAL